jgi:uncharacterized membrane protein
LINGGNDVTKKEQRKMEIKIAVIISSLVYVLLGYGAGIDFFKFCSEQTSQTTTTYWCNLSPIVIALMASMIYHWKTKKKVSE